MRARRSVWFALPLLALLVYLLAWPVPVDPVAWEAPQDLGLVDPFQPDERLAKSRGLDLDSCHSPEDLTSGRDGALYAGCENGDIVRIDGRGGSQLFASPGGRPLGLEGAADGSILIANAVLGIQRVSTRGVIETVIDKIDGTPVTANDVVTNSDGSLYFTEASSKFTAADYGGTLPASLLDLNEHGGHGRVIEYDPATDAVRELLTDLNYANGLALSEDEEFLVIAETGRYRLLRYWLKGPRRGSVDVLIDNLPGFPDNVGNGLNGRFWVGLVAPRSALLDRFSARPTLRRIMQRLPAFLRPSPQAFAHVFAIDGNGEVLMNLQDPEARFKGLTGVLETPDRLYFSTLYGNQLPMLEKRDLL